MSVPMHQAGRHPFIAAFLACTMPGLGQVYNGELIKGVSCFILVMVSAALGLRAALLLPDRLLFHGVLAVILLVGVLVVFTIVDAYAQASKSDAAYLLKSYNRWYFYLAAWLLGFAVFSLGQGYIRGHFIEAYTIPTQSMEPTVRQGDYVLADKTAYGRMAPQKGDIVIFLFPDDRSKRYIKRIEALPGDTIALPDGTVEKVPHGCAYVLGDNWEQSLDSRHFSYIPLRDIAAKVRQVYYSSGEEGIRWERIGTVVGRPD